MRHVSGVLALTALLAVGCGKSLSNEDLAGIWLSGCLAHSNGTDTYIDKLTFGEDGSFSYKSIDYAGAGCSNSPMESNGSGAYTLGEASEHVDGATDFNVTMVGSSTVYSIVTVESNKLRVGEESTTYDGSSIDKRHRSLSTDQYTKQ